MSVNHASISGDLHLYDSGALDGWQAVGKWNRASLGLTMGMSEVGAPAQQMYPPLGDCILWRAWSIP